MEANYNSTTKKCGCDKAEFICVSNYHNINKIVNRLGYLKTKKHQSPNLIGQWIIKYK